MENKPKSRPCRLTLDNESYVNLWIMSKKSGITMSMIAVMSVNFTYAMAGLLGKSTGTNMGDSVRAIAAAYRILMPSDTTEFGKEPVKVSNSVDLLNRLLEEANPELMAKIEYIMTNESEIRIE